MDLGPTSYLNMVSKPDHSINVVVFLKLAPIRHASVGSGACGGVLSLIIFGEMRYGLLI